MGKTALFVAAACLTFSSFPASGVVIHPVDDSATISGPNALVVGKWGSNASAVAIGANYAITARHQGGGVGSTVKFGSTNYTVAEVFNIGSVDLRVVRLELNNQPANLTQWVNIYDGAGSLIGEEFTVGGYGKTRDAELQFGGDTYGYSVTSAYSSSPVFGRNVIVAELADQTPKDSPYTSDVLAALFDGPNSSYAIEGEAMLAAGDSGGGWFVWNTTAGEWQVAAVSAYTGHQEVNKNQSASQALFAAYNNASIAAPDGLYGIDLKDYRSAIYTAIPEPGCLALAGLAGLFMMRRRHA
ncbi:MAG: PEP-CTERM sorting domain-containing protein [Phycisphaerales bacterium]|nr:PEP-CTERM sorting domain-containing protein [Phycisphaerales bacterium]